MTESFIPGLAAGVHAPLQPRLKQKLPSAGETEFAKVLQQANEPSKPLVVSQHAASRMQQRGVHLSEHDWGRLGTAVTHAAEKGSRDAYLMYGDMGFVVNVPNRTVITAMVKQQDETIVTNVDSVVVIPRLDR